MANYLDQIPQQLSARRKAIRAARDNPALLPNCLAIIRFVAGNLYGHITNAVIGGCLFPERPILLSVEDASFLNLGATPRLLLADQAWIEAEKAHKPPPEGGARPSPEGAAHVSALFAAVAESYGINHRLTRVFNLVPWLQDMYRDRLDVEYSEDLRRRMDELRLTMEEMPRAIAATGLEGSLAERVVAAFELFTTITASSYRLDRKKKSSVDRRSYADKVQKIELALDCAEKSLPPRAPGRSELRGLFQQWKEANYGLLTLERQLRRSWAGTSLDNKIQELADLLGALHRTLGRCNDEALEPEPQLPIVRADEAARPRLARREVEEAFRRIVFYDIVAGHNHAALIREMRTYGPLSAIIVPGKGRPRYSSEIRWLQAAAEEVARKKTARENAAREGDNEPQRRLRYSLNCLIIPAAAPTEALMTDMADAWLEYCQAAFPAMVKDFTEAAKRASPEAFTSPNGESAEDFHPAGARKILVELTAAFAEWAHTGREPAGRDLLGFDNFREMALGRLNRGAYLPPLHLRPVVDIFTEANSGRRLEMWRRVLGPRFFLDRQLMAVSVLMKDWRNLDKHLALLPATVVKNSHSLASGFAKLRDKSDAFAEHKAAGFFRNFLLEQPDLKTALTSVENQIAIEVDALRSQAESLEKSFRHDQAFEAALRSQSSRIQEQRLAANAGIDQYLAGLMYAIEGNLEAAEGALVMDLTSRPSSAVEAVQPPAATEDAIQRWVEERFKPLEDEAGIPGTTGERDPGNTSRELIHYNLGLVYLKMERYIEARMSFRSVMDGAPHDTSYLYRKWAAEFFAEAAEKIADAENGGNAPDGNDAPIASP